MTDKLSDKVKALVKNEVHPYADEPATPYEMGVVRHLTSFANKVIATCQGTGKGEWDLDRLAVLADDQINLPEPNLDAHTAIVMFKGGWRKIVMEATK